MNELLLYCDDNFQMTGGGGRYFCRKSENQFENVPDNIDEDEGGNSETRVNVRTSETVACLSHGFLSPSM